MSSVPAGPAAPAPAAPAGAALASGAAGRPITELPAMTDLACQRLRALGTSIRFDDDEARQVVAEMRLLRLPARAVLLREGERDVEGQLLLLLSGDVSVEIAELTQEGRVSISALGIGHMLGELAIVDGAPHSATCVAISAVTLACLSRAALDRLIAERPRAAAKLLAAIAQSVSERLRAMNDQLRIYSRLAGHQQAEIARLERRAR